VQHCLVGSEMCIRDSANTQKESYKNNISTWETFKNSVVETLFEKDYATN
jgi:hypothetical protein